MLNNISIRQTIIHVLESMFDLKHAQKLKAELNGSYYTYITKDESAAKSSGIPLTAIAQVYQTFGLGRWTDNGSQYAVPLAIHLEQILTNWATTVLNPVFDNAYSWGSQNRDTSLFITMEQFFTKHIK
jgi:hypothetical protein